MEFVLSRGMEGYKSVIQATTTYVEFVLLDSVTLQRGGVYYREFC